MEKINLENDIKVFGLHVAGFPNGVDDAFHNLIKKIDDKEDGRNYYGISEFKNGKMFYYAAAEEKNEGEAKKFNYDSYTIKSGEYFTETLKNWRTQTDCIKDIFSEMMKDNRIDETTPAIEWYKNDEEMLCMIKAL